MKITPIQAYRCGSTSTQRACRRSIGALGTSTARDRLRSSVHSHVQIQTTVGVPNGGGVGEHSHGLGGADIARQPRIQEGHPD